MSLSGKEIELGLKIGLRQIDDAGIGRAISSMKAAPQRVLLNGDIYECGDG